MMFLLRNSQRLINQQVKKVKQDVQQLTTLTALFRPTRSNTGLHQVTHRPFFTALFTVPKTRKGQQHCTD